MRGEVAWPATEESLLQSPIVYIDHSDIREGALEELKAGVQRLVEFIDAREPQLITYGFYIDAEAAKMTVVAVHPDSASLELHMDIGSEEFRKLAHLLTLTASECYGRPSEGARAAATQGGHAGERRDPRVRRAVRGLQAPYIDNLSDGAYALEATLLPNRAATQLRDRSRLHLRTARTLVDREQEQVHGTVADQAAVFDPILDGVAEVEPDEDA
jgi:hypothetical protein